MAGIFINYRRDDSRGLAGRLSDHLRRTFGPDAVFMDVDTMKPGFDFVKQLDVQVAQCDVVLAIIGANWFDAHDDKGQRRLESAHDYVRIELAAALTRDIPVIPVLVDGAIMPSEDALPDDLKSLARRHALELRYTRFNSDAEGIEFALRGLLPQRKPKWLWPAVGWRLRASLRSSPGACCRHISLFRRVLAFSPLSPRNPSNQKQMRRGVTRGAHWSRPPGRPA
jgi:hypothetical protein